MGTYHYFAYGSNLSTAELQAYCPSAHCMGMARLDGWRLAFTVYAEKRQGGVADIVLVGAAGSRPDEDGQPPDAPTNPLSPVWGILWSIPEEEIPALDAKEGYSPDRPMELNMYRRVELGVMLFVEPAQLSGGAESPALPLTGPPDPIPVFAYEVVRKAPEHVPPSRAYLDLVLSGAHEHELPSEYVAALAAVTTSE